jgi:hypothetical protein
MTLREVLLILGSDRDKDDGVSLPQEAIVELLRRGILYIRGSRHIDLTDRGEELYELAKAGKPTPELE